MSSWNKTRFKFLFSKFRSKHTIQCIIIMGKFVWLNLDLGVQIQVRKSEYLALKF